MAALPPPRKFPASKKATRQILTSTELLLQMGFPKNRVERAIAATGDRGVQLASDWLLAHVFDPSIDEEKPREYILYLCPTGSLLDQIQIFFEKSLQQCGWNGAHNYLPHITLSSYFPVADCSVEHLMKGFHDVIRRVQSEFPDDLILEPYISPNFMGYFVNEKQADVLRKISKEFIKEFKTLFVPGDPNSQKSLHLSLAYQFPSHHTSTLEDLVKEIDQTTPTLWEFRLYSRDSRIKSNEVYKVLFPLVPREVDELELMLGDFVYISPESVKASADDWVEGTSWLTGCSGFLPLNYMEKAPQTDAWTLHKSIPMSQSHNLDFLEDASVGRCPLTEVQQRLSAELASHVRQLSDPSDRKREYSKNPPTTDYDNVEESVCSDPVASNSTVHKDKKEVVLKSPIGPRKLVIIRHGERVDFTFGTWIPYVFEHSGKYTRKDLNMPHLLPTREEGHQAYFKDGPLTQLGHLQARSVGDMMHEMDLHVHHVYCSPSYRCIQTCDSVLRGIGLQSLVTIKVEPGLFEWLAWYQDSMPIWFSPAQFHAMGYNIDLSYTPLITTLELHDKSETCEQFYMRNFFITEKIIKATQTIGGNILMVGHAATLDTCTRQLVGHAPRDVKELHRIIHRVPYCSVAVAEEYAEENEGEKKWHLVEPPFPPFTNSSNARFDWKILLI